MILVDSASSYRSRWHGDRSLCCLTPPMSEGWFSLNMLLGNLSLYVKFSRVLCVAPVTDSLAGFLDKSEGEHA